jgi:periplasmic protein TonB
MSMRNKILEHAVRTGIGLLSAGAIFLLLPLANVVFRFSAHTDKQPLPGQVTLARVAPEEKKKEPTQRRSLRKLLLPSRGNSARDMASRFMPDLSIGGAGDGAVVASEQNLENIVYEEGQTEEPPAVLFAVQPRYPNQARDQSIGGTVSVIIVIERNGRASQVTFENLPHEIFRKPVEEAIARWRFKPAHHKGVPVRIRVRQQFDFGVM